MTAENDQALPPADQTAADWLLEWQAEKPDAKTRTSRVNLLGGEPGVFRLVEAYRSPKTFHALLENSTSISGVPRWTESGLEHGQIQFELLRKNADDVEREQPHVALMQLIPGVHLTQFYDAERKEQLKLLKKTQPKYSKEQRDIEAAITASDKRLEWLLAQDDALFIDAFRQARKLLEAGHVVDAVGDNMLYETPSINQPHGKLRWIDTGNVLAPDSPRVENLSVFSLMDTVRDRFLKSCGAEDIDDRTMLLSDEEYAQVVKPLEKNTQLVNEKLTHCAKLAAYPETMEELRIIFGTRQQNEANKEAGVVDIPLHEKGSARFLVEELRRRAVRDQDGRAL